MANQLKMLHKLIDVHLTHIINTGTILGKQWDSAMAPWKVFRLADVEMQVELHNTAMHDQIDAWLEPT